MQLNMIDEIESISSPSHFDNLGIKFANALGTIKLKSNSLDK